MSPTRSSTTLCFLEEIRLSVLTRTRKKGTLKLFHSPRTELVPYLHSYYPYPVVNWDPAPAFSGGSKTTIRTCIDFSEHLITLSSQYITMMTCFVIQAEYFSHILLSSCNGFLKNYIVWYIISRLFLKLKCQLWYRPQSPSPPVSPLCYIPHAKLQRWQKFLSCFCWSVVKIYRYLSRGTFNLLSS